MKMNNIQFATIGGSMSAFWASFDLSNLIQTALLTLIGTVLSYTFSRIIQSLRRRK